MACEAGLTYALFLSALDFLGLLGLFLDRFLRLHLFALQVLSLSCLLFTREFWVYFMLAHRILELLACFLIDKRSLVLFYLLELLLLVLDSLAE